MNDAVKVKINNSDDRSMMVSILAAAGYVVWIEKSVNPMSLLINGSNYYVCFRPKEAAV